MLCCISLLFRWAVFYVGLLSCNAYAAAAFDPSGKYMSGNWGGARDALSEEGYDFNLDYVGMAASNLSGGADSHVTMRYADQLALGMSMNLEEVLNWDKADFRLTVTERSGRNISNDRISDSRATMFSSAQEIWGRGQTWRLTQMWIRKRLFDESLDVKFGQFGEGEDFNVLPCDFQNLSFCGSQVGKRVGDIWYNWPVSQWALRIKYHLTPDFFAQVGVFEQNPSNLEVGNGFKLSGSGTKGAVFPAEVVWSPTVHGLPGRYGLGYYYSNAKANDVYLGSDGFPQPLSGGAFKSHQSKHGAWVSAQQQVSTHGGSQERGLSISLNWTVHDRATSKVQDSQQMTMVFKGPFDSRLKDDIGFGISRIKVNGDVRKRARLVNSLNGVDDFDDPRFIPIQHVEYNSELYYGIHLTDWVTFRPNVQYVKYPGGVREVDSALIMGLKIQSKF